MNRGMMHADYRKEKRKRPIPVVVQDACRAIPAHSAFRPIPPGRASTIYASILLASLRQWLIQRVVSFSWTLFWRSRDARPPKST